jgi:hypothetical protein
VPVLTQRHDISNSNKAEYRNVLHNALAERSTQPDAATTDAPTATKHILDAFLGMKLAPTHPANIDESFLGLFPFVPGSVEDTRRVVIDNQLHDLVYSGDANPSLADVQTLASNKVSIPSDHYELTTALQRYSIALDVFLSPAHPLCTYFRTWIRNGWIAQHTHVRHFIHQYYKDYPATAYAKFAFWISLRMSMYLSQLSKSGITATLPDLDEFKEIMVLLDNHFPTVDKKWL